MYFDGSKTKDGSGARRVLMDSHNRKHMVSIHLEFECTNNVVEYEALMLGLQKAISPNVVIVKLVGDSKIMVRKVRNTTHCLSPHLKIYKQEVWRLISNFQAFNIIVVPHMCNVAANGLENAASRMSLIRDRFTIEILYKPSIPEKITKL